MTAPICWVDVETISLDAAPDVIWEVGLIEADGTEHHWFLPVDLGKADPKALKIGGYYERHPQGQTQRSSLRVTSRDHFAAEFSRLTAGHHLGGAVVSFDEERLRLLLKANGGCPGWSHRVICVETLAAGHLRLPLPIGLRRTAGALGLKVVEDDLHTALGDARLARDVYMAVTA